MVNFGDPFAQKAQQHLILSRSLARMPSGSSRWQLLEEAQVCHSVLRNVAHAAQYELPMSVRSYAEQLLQKSASFS